jgi:hypothetical protein
MCVCVCVCVRACVRAHARALLYRLWVMEVKMEIQIFNLFHSLLFHLNLLCPDTVRQLNIKAVL